MSVVVSPKGNDISWEELADLLHEAFEERLHQGLKFSCSYLTADELKRRSCGSIVLVAKDTDNGLLIGTVTIQINRERSHSWAYHSNLAIKPEKKHSGIASQLFSSLIEIALSHNCEYIKSDTAIGANSSVKWHLKNGFKIVGLDSFSSTNYYSYVFRRQLKSNFFWENTMCLKILFLLSSIKCKLCYHENGNYTQLMELFMMLRRQFT